MTVVVEILTGQRRAIDYVLSRSARSSPALVRNVAMA